ncbi:nucleotidyltransferase family protein [uncultured Algimonas sp.]|uniref:nucleotidyltransferase family protein n=1 Tax=uncultured Algimonas sp. TaxID=1547920 RepID=UPI002620ED93|nr:nucleotidyltransferase family protein [uncultured Algimonas sp.]
MSVRVVILAGQRPGRDALCEQAGVAYKADIPVGGVPMVDRVAHALRAAGLPEPFTLSGYPAEREGFDTVEGGCGPADSALMAAEAGDFPVLLTTCDHALLTPVMVRDFLCDAEASGADFAVGLATRDRISAAYPETKRTYMVFNDVAVSGCNLFYIRNKDGLGAIRFWRDAQHLRKKPVRLAAKIGPAITLRYVLKRLSVSDAFDYASRRIGARAVPVLLDHAEAAIDVDRPGDLALVEEIVARRGERA